jgi:uncharacterized membrane protein
MAALPIAAPARSRWGVRLWLGTFVERARASLFLVPMAGVLAAIGAAELGLLVDRSVGEGTASDLPFVLTSTVDNAREVLTVVAGATITFAGIAFSVSLLVIQLGSGQYSPRVVHTLFRDPFNKRVMGLVVGTFTYCLMVLRSVRSDVDGSDAVIPSLSVTFAVALGILTILAIVAFIDHSAHSMDVSEILERVTEEAVACIRVTWSTEAPETAVMAADTTSSGPPHHIRFARSGWVQQIDLAGLVDRLPAGSQALLDTHPGRYAVAGTIACTVMPGTCGRELDEHDDLDRRVLSSIGIGETRTMQQDVSYGLRQLTDVAVKALSAGINDPTTAQDAIFHSAAVLLELLRRHPPSSEWTGERGQHLVLLQQPTHDELVALAFDETRRASSSHPTVCIYLLEAIALLLEPLGAEGHHHRTAALRDQARLVLEGCRSAEPLPQDLALVTAAYEKRFEAVG